MADFSNYSIEALRTDPHGVYGLADGLLPEMAEATGYMLGEYPTVEALSDFISHIGPAKTLQDNIGLVQARLGTGDDAVNIAADWVERSGALEPVRRGFKENVPLPEKFSATIMMGGVANWMLRRRNLIERLNPNATGTVFLALGGRAMADGEHQLVATLADRSAHDDERPEERDFGRAYIEPFLVQEGFYVSLSESDHTVGDHVLDDLVTSNKWIAEPGKKILVVGNAPSAIQSAGQVREAIKRVNPEFDEESTQLYMIGDSLPVARKGQGKATHQNGPAALGALARSALYLHRS